jgi:succinylarginine dihydrolase
MLAGVLRAADAAARVAAVVDLVRLPVLADLRLEPAVLVLVQRPVPATQLLAQLPVLEPPEVVVALAAEEEPEALVELLSNQSFSAAMARTTP